MLLAGICGKASPEAERDEDMLTSTVFSHLRYVAPPYFWHELLTKALMVDVVGESGTTLASDIAGQNLAVKQYERLDICFWPRISYSAEPDLILTFSGGRQVDLVILIEAKFMSGKSGSADDDQLLKYYRILHDTDTPFGKLRKNAAKFLVYLTANDPVFDVRESLHASTKSGIPAAKIYVLRWQDIQDIAEREYRRLTLQSPNSASGLVLRDVSRFLRKLRLEYFCGFIEMEGLASVSGAFYDSLYFRKLPLLDYFPIQSGAWMNV
jgi:hypothetical protein